MLSLEFQKHQRWFVFQNPAFERFSIKDVSTAMKNETDIVIEEIGYQSEFFYAFWFKNLSACFNFFSKRWCCLLISDTILRKALSVRECFHNYQLTNTIVLFSLETLNIFFTRQLHSYPIQFSWSWAGFESKL